MRIGLSTKPPWKAYGRSTSNASASILQGCGERVSWGWDAGFRQWRGWLGRPWRWVPTRGTPTGADGPGDDGARKTGGLGVGGGPELFEVGTGDGGEWVDVGEVVEGEIGLSQGIADLGFRECAGGEGVADGGSAGALDLQVHGGLRSVRFETAVEGEVGAVFGDGAAPEGLEGVL